LFTGDLLTKDRHCWTCLEACKIRAVVRRNELCYIPARRPFEAPEPERNTTGQEDVMRKIAVVIMALSSFMLFPKVAAAADVFSGACTLTGTAHLSPPAAVGLPQPGTFTFNTDGSTRNHCSGKLNGVNVVNMTAWATANGSGKLSCVESNGKGTGTLWIGGKAISFALTIVGTGPEVTIVLKGAAGGNATGQASFATDTSAAGDCRKEDADTLTFIIAAIAAKLGG
jgi:hypothetical protein